MADIYPELLEQARKNFEQNKRSDGILSSLFEKLTKGSKSYTDAFDYADHLGKALADALSDTLTVDTLPDGILYHNIINRMLDDVGGDAFKQAMEQAELVQKAINEEAEVGIAVQKCSTQNGRINSIVNAVSGQQVESAKKRLIDGVRMLPQSAVTDTLESNATFQGKSGLNAVIVRRSTNKCCEWCSRLAGTYSYPFPGRDVYRRHANCRCSVEYVVGKERTTVRSGVTTSAEQDILEERKLLGLSQEKTARQRQLEAGLRSQDADTILETVKEHHEALGDYTPESFKQAVEDMGYTVLPLGKGNYKGVPFEEGGGYRINFGGDGLLQYHPEEHSHHNGAYYKIKTGKGEERYDLQGKRKTD